MFHNHGRKLFVLLFALLFGKSQLFLLLLLDHSDFSLCDTSPVTFFHDPTMRLNRPHRTWIICLVEGLLSLFLLLAHLNLLLPELVVHVHGFPLDPLLSQLLCIVVPDLLLELLALTSKLVDASCQAFLQHIGVIFLDFDELRVLFQQAESIKRLLRNAWP